VLCIGTLIEYHTTVPFQKKSAIGNDLLWRQLALYDFKKKEVLDLAVPISHLLVINLVCFAYKPSSTTITKHAVHVLK
jgi:hypothetical protein